MILPSLLLFVHVVAVIAWVGGAMMHLALMGLAKRDRDAEAQARLLSFDGRLAVVVYIPGSLLVLATGIAMVLVYGGSFGTPFISVGLAVWVITFVVGAAFYAPAGKRLAAAIEAGGPASPGAQLIVDRIERVSWISLILLLIAVFAMTTKLAF